MNDNETAEAVPFIWLQEHETRGEADCGCCLEYLPDASIMLCPMHEAAPVMLEALRNLREKVGTVIAPWEYLGLPEIDAALAAAEGVKAEA